MSKFIDNHRSLQQAVCLMVCLCAWRGPIPVLHDHQALACSELQERHANNFHDGRQVEEIVGLHWHLGFPEDVTGEQCPLRDDASSDLSLFACASATSSFETQNMAALQLACGASAEDFIGVVVPNAKSRPTAGAPSSFLQTLLTEVSLSAVTGVCLV